jgi:hypothetical protein
VKPYVRDAISPLPAPRAGLSQALRRSACSQLGIRRVLGFDWGSVLVATIIENTDLIFFGQNIYLFNPTSNNIIFTACKSTHFSDMVIEFLQSIKFPDFQACVICNYYVFHVRTKQILSVVVI